MNHAFAYLSTSGFLGLPIEKPLAIEKGAKKPYAIAGINWDGSVTNRPGARFGPSAIRPVSYTHLDVYKRQSITGRPRRSISSPPSCAISASPRPTAKMCIRDSRRSERDHLHQ